MSWHGWIWRRGRWHHVCAAATLAEAGRLLLRLCPGVPCARHGLTAGAPPDWEPGRFGPRAEPPPPATLEDAD
jgi:hypothetical protein